jgi:hypothetical protein
MVLKIDITNFLPIEVGIDSPMVAEDNRLTAQAEPIEPGEDEVDKGGKTC